MIFQPGSGCNGLEVLKEGVASAGLADVVVSAEKPIRLAFVTSGTTGSGCIPEIVWEGCRARVQISSDSGSFANARVENGVLRIWSRNVSDSLYYLALG